MKGAGPKEAGVVEANSGMGGASGAVPESLALDWAVPVKQSIGRTAQQLFDLPCSDKDK